MVLLKKVGISQCYQGSGVSMWTNKSRSAPTLSRSLVFKHKKYPVQVLCSQKKEIPIVEARSMDEIYDTLAEHLVPTAASGTNLSMTHIVGLAGPPGAEKTTIASEIVKRVNKIWPQKASSFDSQVEPPEIAVVLPMDGVHLYRHQLDSMENPKEAHARRGGKDVKSEAKVHLLAVFDGHGGSEASEMAKQHILDYFLVHVIVGAFKKASNINNQHDLITPVECSRGCLPQMKKESLHELLKEALVGAIHDIDQKFSLEAVEKRYSAGSTASVVLLMNDEELMVANVGDSKVILCSGYAEELTSDHHPDRDDERARVESFGGYVVDWDIPRVNGILAVSRAIGDVSLKRYGVIAEPEMIGWRNITVKDKYLVVASDGIFESLTPENVCQLIEDANAQENGTSYDKTPFLPSYSLAQYIVKTALEKGSTDNLSAIVVPLAQATSEIIENDKL